MRRLSSGIGRRGGQRSCSMPVQPPAEKTALMAEREPALAKLLGLDIDPKRLERVRENLTRGNLHAEVISGDAGNPAGWWDGVPFDRILLDAPCSGLGVIRRHPDIRLRKSPSDIDKLPELQTRLLQAGVEASGAGGPPGLCATCTSDSKRESRPDRRTFLRGTPDAACCWRRTPGKGLGRISEKGTNSADRFFRGRRVPTASIMLL